MGTEWENLPLVRLVNGETDCKSLLEELRTAEQNFRTHVEISSKGFMLAVHDIKVADRIKKMWVQRHPLLGLRPLQLPNRHRRRSTGNLRSHVSPRRHSMGEIQPISSCHSLTTACTKSTLKFLLYTDHGYLWCKKTDDEARIQEKD